ncbi:glycoside hydrolase superfamily [Kalaharituber pfeilii]|nr:glycoside hydrolase superfamily [Kalaharituber pfeilii]
MYLKSTILFITVSSVQLAAAFRNVTAQEAWTAMNPGWILGNTLVAVPDEGSWHNPKVTEQTFNDIKEAKFKSVRIPVTWRDYFAAQGLDYKPVVDWSLQRRFWAVLNVHHDNWQWADFTVKPETLAERTLKFEKLWRQIADRFKWKSEKLILEPLNEPAGSSSQGNADRYNDANLLWVNIIRSSGGYNKDRLLTIPGLNTNIQRTVDWWKEPVGVGNYILHVHDYDPWAFVSTSWGHTFWRTDALQNRFHAPALIAKYQLAAQLWDNGNDHFNRIARKWRDPVKLSLIQTAVKGIPNTRPTYNQEPVTYFTPPGAPVTGNREVKLDWNSNTLYTIREDSQSGRTLRRGSDYTITSTGVAFTRAYLSSILGRLPSTLGSLLWIIPPEERPSQSPSPSILSQQPTKTLLSPTQIPLISSLFHGVAIKRDGGILKDDWTIWLGPLEQGRLNWGNFKTSGDNVVLHSGLLSTIKNAGQEVDLTLEFWPRIEGNNVTVTVRVLQDVFHRMQILVGVGLVKSGKWPIVSLKLSTK